MSADHLLFHEIVAKINARFSSPIKVAQVPEITTLSIGDDYADTVVLINTDSGYLLLNGRQQDAITRSRIEQMRTMWIAAEDSNEHWLSYGPYTAEEADAFETCANNLDSECEFFGDIEQADECCRVNNAEDDADD